MEAACGNPNRPQGKERLLSTSTATPAEPSRRTPPAERDKKRTAADLLDLVLTSLDDDKAQDVVQIGLAGKSAMADTMVIASGRSHRHVGAIADHLARKIKEGGYGIPRVEGLPNCDWVLIDAGDVIVHLFRPEVRVFYNLEKMWTADLNTDQKAV